LDRERTDGSLNATDPELLDSLWHSTIPQLVRERASTNPSGTAIRYKHNGIYRELTWADYLRNSQAIAATLIDRGLRPTERVLIIGDPCPEWLMTDIGTQFAAGVAFGVYTTSSIPQIDYLLEHSKTRFAFAQNQEHVDKLLGSTNSNQLELIMVADLRAMFEYDDSRIVAVDDVLTEGAQLDLDAVATRADNLAPTDPAIITYTSGTTGQPKAVMHTHRDVLVGLVYSEFESFPELLSSGEQRSVSHLALAHALERSVAVYLPLASSLLPHIGEPQASLQATMHEVQPSFFHGVPRVYEKLASQLQVSLAESWAFQRWLYKLADNVAERYVDRVWAGQRPGFLLSAGWRAGRSLIFRHLLMKVGMGEVRVAMVGAAPTPPEIQKMWLKWGVSLRNMYGSTETGPIICQRGAMPKPGDVGLVLAPKQIRLAEDGEIMAKGMGLFSCYAGPGPLTEVDPSRPEWFATGDIGELTDSGTMRIIDRKKDIMITAGGKNIAPTGAENAMRSSPYISEAVLCADGRRYPTALIELDFDSVSQWARAEGIVHSGQVQLTANPQVIELIGIEVETANGTLARAEQVKKFRILPRELDPEVGDTTPTRKIQRSRFLDRFSDLIEEMYR